MKIYKKTNVFDETLNRIRYIFDEFPNVIANISGGKDSTVIFNLAMTIAKEKNRLPLKVMFIDQEAEWQCVIDNIRNIMYREDVEPLWLQIPIKIFNATSTIEPWLYCWQEGKEWIREKEEISIKENRYGTDRFKQLFKNFTLTDYPDIKTCYLAGVRTQESPGRFMGCINDLKYKAITCGKILSKEKQHYTFYPIYDWSYSDIWKSIHDNKWDYCKLYDYMYQYGIPIPRMRVSNVHHETAIHSLFFLQEIESDTWNRIVKRISGINTAGKLGSDDFFVKNSLPFMFKNWQEYRDYLLENLITDTDAQKRFKRRFANMEMHFYKNHYNFDDIDLLYRAHINAILCNDYEHTKLENFRSSHRNTVDRKSLLFNYRHTQKQKETIC